MKKITSYESELDEFLTNLRKDIPESPSQAQERKKHEQIAQLRDHPQSQSDSNIWTDF